MVILRSLIEFNTIYQTAIALATGDQTKLRDAFCQGFTDAIYAYLNIQKVTRLATPVNPSVGVVSTAIPVPGSGLASLETAVPSKDLLLNYIKNQVQSPFPLPNPSWHILFFSALGQYVNTPLQCKLGPTSLPPTMVGSGVTVFPLMPFMGIPCWATLLWLGLGGKIQGPRDFTEILSNYVYLGLLANFTAPMATFGTAIPPVGPYSGVTVVTPWIFLDVMDWDKTGQSQGGSGITKTWGTGKARIPQSMLDALGLNGLMNTDGSISSSADFLAFQNSLSAQPDVVQVDCNVKYNGVSVVPAFTLPTNCDDQVVMEIYNTGNTTSASQPTSATEIMTSATISNINANFLSTSADNKVLSFMDELSSTIPEASATYYTNVPQFEYFIADSTTINISVIQPTINTNYVATVLPGEKKTSVFEVF